MSEERLKAGERVVLSSGGPPMTVNAFWPEKGKPTHADVGWFAGIEMKAARLPLVALVRAPLPLPVNEKEAESALVTLPVLTCCGGAQELGLIKRQPPLRTAGHTPGLDEGKWTMQTPAGNWLEVRFCPFCGRQPK